MGIGSARRHGPGGVQPEGCLVGRRVHAGGAADGSELIYTGKTADELRAIYTQVAHSLKARYYMHTAATNPAAYALALSEAVVIQTSL